MSKRILLLMLAVVAVPVIAWSRSGDTKANEAKLKRWQEQGPLFTRLQKNAEYFAWLPPKRQRQIVKLYDQIEDLPEYKQAELLNTLERYNRWLTGLKPDNRKRVADAKTNKERLRVIKNIRDEQWMQKQPRAIRDEINGAPQEKKVDLIKHYREAERKRRLMWRTVHGFWTDIQFKRQPTPVRQADLSRDLAHHVDSFLIPQMTNAEKRDLREAEREGWPWYPRMLVHLASKYPVALPQRIGPTKIQDLPLEIRKRFRFKTGKLPKSLAVAQGKYPDFIIEVIKFAKKRDITFPNDYWPYNAKGLSPGVRDFVEHKLLPSLSADDRNRLSLADAKGEWPLYPVTLESLAKKYNLQIPWQVLPGPQEYWERYRFPGSKTVHSFIVLPKQKLRKFARFDLTTKERSALQLLHPGAWERLSEAYFSRMQKKLKRQQDDMEKE